MREELVARVTRTYQEEKAAGRKAMKRTDIPLSYEHMTPEWLTAVLCDTHPGAHVTGFSLGEPDMGTSARRRIHLEYDSRGRELGLPASTFAKASQELIHRVSYVLNGSTNKEADFYNIVRPRLSVEVINPYFANYDVATGNSILLMEDLEGRATFCDESSIMSRGDAEQMTLLLADMHAEFATAGAFATIKDHFGLWPEHWRKICENEMEQYSNQGFVAAEHVIPRRLFMRYEQVWPRTIDSVNMHANLPHTFNHGDTHLANWYRTNDGRIGLTDWQGAVTGHWSRDLVYAFGTAFSLADRRAWERDLLSLYLERSSARGIPMPSPSDAFRYYRQQSLSALAYWTVTYRPSPGMPANMQPGDRTLDFVQRLAQTVDDLDALDSFN